MSAQSHRHGLGPEHEFEPEPGLPEPLPAGERLLWQGAPDWRRLAIEVFHIRKVAAYFSLLLAWKWIADCYDGATVLQGLWGMLQVAPLPLAGLLLLAGLARWSASTTLYTITDRRVVMRIGIVLSITFNLPFARICGADVRQGDADIGDLCLHLGENDRIAYVHLWPHARPWELRQPQPSLRCIADVSRVARLLVEAWGEAGGRAASHGQASAARSNDGRLQTAGAS